MKILMKKYGVLLAAIVLVAGLLVLPDMALASSTTSGGTGSTDFGGVGGKLCEVVRAITGNLGKAIATIAVVFLGIGAFFGKVTWGLAVAVGIGIFAIFGAASVVARFSGGDGTCTTTSTS